MLAGVLVYLSATVISAYMPNGAAISVDNAQLSVLLPSQVIAKISLADVYGQSHSVQSVPSNAKTFSSNIKETIVHIKTPQEQPQDIAANFEDEMYDRLYDSTVSMEAAPAVECSQNDKILIARVVYAEARGEPFEGQVAVATVVLNRYVCGKFGNSISSVVFAPEQFAVSGRYNEKMLKAVEEAIDRMGEYPDNLLFFQASTRKTWRNFVYFDRIGGHTFFCSAE